MEQVQRAGARPSKEQTAKLPFSIEAEKAVLGAIFVSPERYTHLQEDLTPDFFFQDAHGKIFAAMLALYAESSTPDVLTVAAALRGEGQDNPYLQAAYLAELMNSAPVAQNIDAYVAIIRKDYFLRNIIRTCQETINRAMGFEGSIESYVEDIEKQFLAITESYDNKAGIVDAGKVLTSTIEMLKKRIAMDGTITGVPTGFNDLDAITGGLGESDLIILAARPGMGKTALVLNFATNAAFVGKKVALFTLEMSKEQLMTRVLSTVAKVDSSRLRKGDLSEEEQDRIVNAARQIHGFKENIGIDETPGITLVELRSRVRRYHKENGLDLVIIDYLQLMGSTGGADKSREREISEISMGLKELAKELNIPVVALAQLNRGPDARPDKRPKISDLRESGSMEQDADMIFFVYRDEYYNPNSEMAGKAEVIIGKNRHGETGSITLAYQPNFVCFQNLYRERDLGD